MLPANVTFPPATDWPILSETFFNWSSVAACPLTIGVVSGSHVLFVRPPIVPVDPSTFTVFVPFPTVNVEFGASTFILFVPLTNSADVKSFNSLDSFTLIFPVLSTIAPIFLSDSLVLSAPPTTSNLSFSFLEIVLFAFNGS